MSVHKWLYYWSRGQIFGPLVGYKYVKVFIQLILNLAGVFIGWVFKNVSIFGPVAKCLAFCQSANQINKALIWNALNLGPSAGTMPSLRPCCCLLCYKSATPDGSSWITRYKAAMNDIFWLQLICSEAEKCQQEIKIISSGRLLSHTDDFYLTRTILNLQDDFFFISPGRDFISSGWLCFSSCRIFRIGETKVVLTR